MNRITLDELTIVSITYNNPGIHKTINSIIPLLNSGCSVVIQNGGSKINDMNGHQKISIYNEEDDGIYSALNLGIKKVTTKYFMLIHAGDEFIGNTSIVEEILNDLHQKQMTLSINTQFIGKRKHSSQFWRPWMLNFGVQPPHLPSIYETTFYKNRPYKEEITIISDFDFFTYSCNWTSFINHNRILIKMETGGHTSNGLQSFFSTSKEFIRTYGIKGVFFALMRIPLKLLQLI